MFYLLAILALAGSYLLGSIPNGLWLGLAVWRTDLRQHGSGNTGATNAWRTLGRVPGTIIFLLDALKGALAVGLGLLLDSPTLAVLCGMVAILGHTCSLFMRFHGGKGVATGLGVLIMLMPKVALLVFLLWLAIVRATRYVSLGSIVAAAFVPILAWLFSYDTVYILFGLLAAILVIVRHHANIVRLMNGTENQIHAARH